MPRETLSPQAIRNVPEIDEDVFNEDDTRIPIAPVVSDAYDAQAITTTNLITFLQAHNLVSFRYTEDPDADDPLWHTDRANDDTHYQFRIGDDGPWSLSVSLANASAISTQYAETNSENNDDWHDDQGEDDDWIRFGIGEPVAYTPGVPLTQGTSGAIEEGDGIILTTNADDETIIAVDKVWLNNQQIKSVKRYADETAYAVGEIVIDGNPLLYQVNTAVPATNTQVPNENTSFTRLGRLIAKGDGITFTTTDDEMVVAIDADRLNELIGANVKRYTDETAYAVDDIVIDNSPLLYQVNTAVPATNTQAPDENDSFTRLGRLIAKGDGITFTTTDDEMVVAVTNPFSADDETKLDNIDEEATKNSAGDGIEIDADGVTAVEDSYIEDLIEDSEAVASGIGDVWFEHVSIRHTNQFVTDTGARWHSYAQPDTTGYIIRVIPTDDDVAIFEAVTEDSQIQIRQEDGAVVNTFTVEADPDDPDSDGRWLIYGDYDNVRTFDPDTNYQFYFSQSRLHKIETDNSKLIGDGTHANPVTVKPGGLRDEDIASNLSTTERKNIRLRVGIPRITAGSKLALPTNPIGGDVHIYAVDVSDLQDHISYFGGDVTTADEGALFKWDAISAKWRRQVRAPIIDLADSTVSDNHIDSGMDDDQQQFFRTKIDARTVYIGNTVPSHPLGEDLLIYDAETTVANHFETDGSTARTTAYTGDIYRYDFVDATDFKWVLEIEGRIFDTRIPTTLTATQKRNVRDKIDSPTITISAHVPSDPLTDDIHVYSGIDNDPQDHRDTDALTAITQAEKREIYKWNGTYWIKQLDFDSADSDQTAAELKDALETLTGDDRLSATAIKDIASGGGLGSYYEHAERTIVAEADRNTASEVSILLDTGTLYNLKIARDTDLYHLPDTNTGAQIRVSQDRVSWMGRVTERSVDSNLYTIKVNFHQRRGTFTIDDTVKVEIGSIPTKQVTYLYGKNQAGDRRVTGVITAANHGITTQRLKQFDIGLSVNGGIDITLEDSNDATDIDGTYSTNDTDVIIKIDEAGTYKCSFHFVGNTRIGDTVLSLRKAVTGADDIVLVDTPGYRGQATDIDITYFTTVYQGNESEIEIASGDQLYLRCYDFPTGTDNTLTGFIRIEREG